jgi:Flp pilus assembly protein TadB
MASNSEGMAGAVREDARHMRESVSRDNLEEKLEGVVEDRPAVRPFLEFRPLAIAVAIAAVLTLIVALVTSVAVGAVVLVVSFFAAWAFMALRSYDRRRPSEEAFEDREKSAEAGGTDPAPYSG